MKLTSTWIDQTQNQFNMRAVPDEHPVSRRLHEVFGEHTFFLDRNGLNIVEPIDPDQGNEARACKVVCVAGWNDADPPSLVPHDPVSTEVVIELEAKH